MIAMSQENQQRMAEPAPVPENTAGPTVRVVEVPQDREGQRLDNFLVGQLKGVPKTHIYRLLRTGQVRINGKRCKADSRLAAGDKVRIPPVRVADPTEPAVASDRALEALQRAILFEDKRFLVLDKPHGLAAHGGSGIKLGAIEMLRQMRPHDTLELVHRLDRDTSGVLLLAKKRSALTAAQAAMREGTVRKRYLALIVGRPRKDKTLVNVALRKSVLRGGERMVAVDDDGKPSLSEFRVIERYRDASLCEVLIDTGRTHQIRVHAQHMGHPVAGDPKYGDAEVNQALRAYGLTRLFLHAAELSLSLPDGGEQTFSAPLPDNLKAVLDRLPRK